MRKKVTVGAISIMFMLLAFVPLNAQGWQIYDGGVLPAATGSGGDSLDISNVADDSPGAGLIAEIIDDPDIAGNKIFKYLHPDGKTTYRHYFDDSYSDSNLTIVARIKAEDDAAYDRAFDIRWDNKNAGTRDELRIWTHSDTLELEKADLKKGAGVDLVQWHTFRIVVSGDMSTVYVDEDPTPVVTGVTTASTTSGYLKLGDGSGDAIGGYLDWFVLDTSGAFAPGAGTPIPAELFVDGGQKWLVYDGGVLPGETGSGGDSLDISNVSDDSPGAGMVQEIIEDHMIPGNKIFKYLQPDGKTNFRHYFPDSFTDSAFTIMARVKGEVDTTYDRAFDFEWRNGNAGTRDKLLLWTRTNLLELDNDGAKVDPGVSFYKWHTFRIAVNGDMATVYIDENPTPVHIAATTNSTSDTYLKIGDGSGDNIGGYVDWITVNMNGAWAPGEGTMLPMELFVDDYLNPIEEFDPWLVYDGSVLPAETGSGGDSLDITNVSDNAPGAGMIQEIIDDYIHPGNKIFKYLQPDGKTSFRHYFPDTYTDSAFTIMARVRGEVDTTYDRSFDFDWRNGNAGTRDKLLLWTRDNLLELDNDGSKVDPGVNLYKWHTFRVAINGDMATVYIDENPMPIHSAATTNSTSDTYLKMGDGSGDAIGGYVDWVTLNMDGAWAPGEGALLPMDLVVDDYLNPFLDFDPWLVYDGSVLPAETGSGGDSLDITNVSDASPGAGMVQEILDDPDISGNKIFKYLQPDGKTNFRHYFPDTFTDSAFTIMARVKGDTSAVFDRAFDFEWRNGNAGTRDKFFIWGQDSTIELDNVGTKVNTGASLYDWHTYRIVVNGDYTEVYMDENLVPMASGITVNGTSDTYLKIGDGSGDNIGGYVDWVILNMSGAWPPYTGLEVPEALFVDKTKLPEPPKWLVYDASILPAETAGAGGDTLDLSSISDGSPGTGFVEEIIDDLDNTGNKLLKYLQPDGAGKTMYRHYFGDEFVDSSFTMLARIRGEQDVAYERAFDLQWRNGNASSRDELRIWPADSTLELEKAGVEIKVDMDLRAFHTYRIVVDGDFTQVFVDEYSQPFIEGTSTEGTSDSYIKIGDGSSDVIGGYLDYCILDVSGAFIPGDGLPIPPGLIIDKFIKPVKPGWLVYDASILPTETGSGGDSLYFEDLSSDSPGADFVEAIIDDPDIAGNKILKYLMPTAGNTRMYRYYFDETYGGKEFTLISRIKGENDPLYDRSFDLQWRFANANVRDEFRMYTANAQLKLEKSTDAMDTDIDLYAWHTYRIAVYGDSTVVFIDENPTAAITGVASEGTSDNYIKIGDGGSATVGGYVDWCILELSGAYAPGEGVAIPEELFVDNWEVAVDDQIAVLPKQFKLAQNYPNPFNPTTTINYELPKSSKVTIKLFDMLGKEVMTVVNKEQPAGYYSLNVEATRLASGIYFYRMIAGDFVQTKKMMLLK